MANYSLMIIGQQEAKVDSKNRCALPKKFRDALGSAIVITQGYEDSLILVAEGNFSAIVSETANLPFTIQAVRHTNRYLLGNADKVELDVQGRFIVPDYLRRFAAISEDVVFIGVGTYIEMWDIKKWADYQQFLQREGSAIADSLREVKST